MQLKATFKKSSNAIVITPVCSVSRALNASEKIKYIFKFCIFLKINNQLTSEFLNLDAQNNELVDCDAGMVIEVTLFYQILDKLRREPVPHLGKRSWQLVLLDAARVVAVVPLEYAQPGVYVRVESLELVQVDCSCFFFVKHA